MKRLVKLVRVLTVLVVFAFSLSVYFAFAAEGQMVKCGETDLNEAVWGEDPGTCPTHPSNAYVSCEKIGSMTSCTEYCCGVCYYPGIQPN